MVPVPPLPLGDLARVAARTVTAAVRTLTGEPTLAVGIVGCIQTHGSLANWYPHLHLIATDGGFRPDGTVVPWPAQDTVALTEAFRRAVLRLVVRRGLFEPDEAQAMLAWPHAGFRVHDTVRVPDADVAFALRLARYCARNPVALERLAYDAPTRQVRYRSDKADGPTAGTDTVDPLEFLARVTAHIPNKHQVMTRSSTICATPATPRAGRRGATRAERVARRHGPLANPPPNLKFQQALNAFVLACHALALKSRCRLLFTRRSAEAARRPVVVSRSVW